MTVRVQEGDGVALVRLSGLVTAEDGVGPLRTLIVGLLQQGSENIVLDLRQVTEIDSSGLAELITSHEAAAERGGELKLARLPGSLEQVLRITRLDRLFPIFADEREASRSFPTPAAGRLAA